MKFNYHTHCEYCGHANGCCEDYVKEALKSNLKILGFSDHGPLPGDGFGFRMDYDNLKQYINEINILKTEYKDKIKLLCGLEIEYISSFDSYYEKLLKNKTVDYLILGQHYYEDTNNNIHNIYDAECTDCFIDYAQSSVKGMKTGYFKYLAHPDLMYENNFKWDENCDKAADIIIDAAEKYHFILEINANGFRKGLSDMCDGVRYQYPHDSFWKKVSGRNINVIIGCDAHDPAQLNDIYNKIAFDYCRKMKLHLVNLY